MTQTPHQQPTTDTARTTHTPLTPRTSDAPGAPARITTPFTGRSTAAEVIADIDLTGRRAVVTGGASGIGVETARTLASAGAEVTLAVRDVAAGRRTAADITRTTGNGRIEVAALDLSDQRSVTAFVKAWEVRPLHLLINNAGVMMTPELRTPEGWELQFATNHLGHFTLTTGLRSALAAAEGARVVSLSSVAHVRDGLDFDDLHFRTRPYDPEVAYAQSKTADVLFAVEAHRRWSAEGITVNAVHPGAIAATNLSRHMSQERLDQALSNGGYTFKTPEQGAATSVLVATHPSLAAHGGRYFEDCNEAVPHTPGLVGGVSPHALDPARATRLWQVTEAILGPSRDA